MHRRGTGVTVKDYENINQSLKRFKRKVDDSKVLEIVKNREYYDKPSVVNKRRKAAARARWLRQLAKESLRINQF